ncbi:MAG TPA: hypothetical protein VIN57_07055 [Magnetovibrio sp.]
MRILMFKTGFTSAIHYGTALGVLLAIGACGESSTNQMDQASTTLAEHYATHPPASGWTVESIIQDNKGSKLDTIVIVTSDTDVQRIKMLSRMEQFTIAKLACPTITPALRDALGKTRVWVHLQTSKKEDLTSSICPEK